MIDIESLAIYPELVKFLSADNAFKQERLAAILKTKYVVLVNGERMKLNPLQIVAEMGKLDHLNAILRLQQEDSYWNYIQRRFSYALPKFAIDANDNLALCLAAQEGNLDIVNRLLSFRKIQTGTNSTTLKYAIRSGSVEMVKRLFSKKRIPVSADALKLAAQYGHVAMFKHLFPLYLRQMEASRVAPNEVVMCLRKALSLAAASGQLEIIQLLLQRPDVSSSSEAIKQALKSAIQGKAPNSTTENSTLPASNRLQIVQYLREKYSEQLNNVKESYKIIYLKDRLGKLSWWCTARDYKKLEPWLLPNQHGLLQYVDEEGKTYYYHVDAISESVKELKLDENQITALKKIIAPILRKQKHSFTEIQESADSEQCEVIQQLSNYALDDSLLELAQKNKQKDIVTYLLNQRHDIPTCIINEENMDIIFDFLQRNPFIALTEDQQDCILVATVGSANMEIFNYFAEKWIIRKIAVECILEIAALVSGRDHNVILLQNVLSNEKIWSIIQQKDFDVDSIQWILKWAIKSNSIEVMEYFRLHCSFMFERMNQAIENSRDNEYNFLLNAGSSPEMLTYVDTHFPQLINKTSKKDIGHSFLFCGKNVEAIDWLSKRLARKYNAQDVIRALTDAIKERSIDVINRLLAMPEVKIQFCTDRTSENSYPRLLNQALTEKHYDVMDCLFNIREIFELASTHEEYSLHVSAFIAKKIANLHIQQDTFHQENNVEDDTVFDVDSEEAELYFFIIRHLIKKNSSDSVDDLRFLLEIPAIRRVAHTYRGCVLLYRNELLRLSQRIGNEAAAAILLEIPAVRQLAVQNNYYRENTDTHQNARIIDLRYIAEHSESRMMALSASEEARLTATSQLYNQAIIMAGGVEQCLEDLKDDLKRRYHDNPATIIKSNGESIVLPCEWDGFQRLALSAEERELALKAYYQHKTHTALRFLSIPNHWLAAHPSFADRINRCARFQDYKPLIVTCWYAAKDSDRPPVAGGTVETRICQFIDELYEMGRAHNKDKTRQRIDRTTGKPLVRNGVVQYERYDDLLADDPTCHNGIKRSLFQSVFDHPIMDPQEKLSLTIPLLKQEIKEFVREHFINTVTGDNVSELKGAYNDYIQEGKPESTKTLKILDISINQQKKFIQYLRKKYGAQFDADPNFMRTIKTRFSLKDNDAHAFNFSAETDLQGILSDEMAVYKNDFNRLLKGYTKIEQKYKKKNPSFSREMKNLHDGLDNDISQFFNRRTFTAEDFQNFSEGFIQKISKVEGLVTTHRGWGGYNPYLKGFLTALAHISVVPAITVAWKSKHGYVKTFFGQYETNSSEHLQKTKQKLTQLGNCGAFKVK